MADNNENKVLNVPHLRFPEFSGEWIQTKKKDLIRNACGSTFLEISANEIRKIKVAVPVQNEQEQIAKLLSLIDERIATQNKIIEKLQSLIKGLVDELMTVLLKGKLYPFSSLVQYL